MTLVFVSNFMNIHQEPLCKAFYKILGDDFLFVETTSIDPDRIEMGFEKAKYPFVKNITSNDIVKRECEKAIMDSDVVIIGSAPDYILSLRLQTKKLAFKYSERFFKGGNSIWERFRYRISSYKHIRPLKKQNIFFLCASAYTAQDINRYEKFPHRCFKWGYFREIVPVDCATIVSKKVPHSILWAGRLIDWKHPELAIEIAVRLKKDGIPFTLTVIGNGDMKETIDRLIKKNNLCDDIHMVGAKTPDEVRAFMEKSEIFMASSDYKEGWGVVINEAMNSCCAVVASHAMGAVPFLIKDNYNGVVFQNECIDDLYYKVRKLLTCDKYRQSIQTHAFTSLKGAWDAEIAAERFLNIAQDILHDRGITFYADGPCSEAKVIFNNWYLEK